jgi:deoxyribodipyrimidine photo-lyase
MRTLMWFRRDLRVQDNRALFEAARIAKRGVVGIWIATPGQWRNHDDARCKVAFWFANVKLLAAELSGLNIPLLLRTVESYTGVPEVLRATARDCEATALYFNKEYEVNEARRDRRVTDHLVAAGLEVESFHDRTLLPPSEPRTRQNNFYRVFTPYKRGWLDRVENTRVRVFPAPKKQAPTGIENSTALANLPARASGSQTLTLWPAGEEEARKRLQIFVSERVTQYDAQRDIPSLDGTSQLSPYLAAGVLSPRQCFDAANRAAGTTHVPLEGGPGTWCSELIWREFYTHVLFGFPRISMHRPFLEETDQVPWRTDEEAFAAWKSGRTGFPIVDAAMRQLARTGWMHNRLRMVSAMFLTKHLLIDWRRGEQHFMQTLIDGDLAANNGGWQWAASTGTDAAPYFRIFNPFRQSKRFDPDGLFIKKFCPELTEVPAKHLHQVPKASWAEWNSRDYPGPIVDHSQARKRALEAFGTAKAQMRIR